MINNSQKGVSLYIAFMIMTTLLVIGLGISTILLSEIKTLRGMGESVIAFYAADTGIEKAIYEEADSSYSDNGYLDLNGNGIEDGEDARYQISGVEAGKKGCPSEVNFCIRSVGIYKKTRRAIEIKI